MERMQMKCECCGIVHDLRKTSDIPAHVFFMRCNFCPDCQDKMNDDYSEWWDDIDNGAEPKPTPVGDNQLCMPFIFDEMGIPKPIEASI